MYRYIIDIYISYIFIGIQSNQFIDNNLSLYFILNTNTNDLVNNTGNFDTNTYYLDKRYPKNN